MAKFKMIFISAAGLVLIGLLSIFMVNGVQNKAIGLRTNKSCRFRYKGTREKKDRSCL